MREQKSLETSEAHPADPFSGRSKVHWLYYLSSVVDAASPSAYSLELVLRNISLLLQVDHTNSTSKAARSKMGQIRF